MALTAQPLWAQVLAKHPSATLSANDLRADVLRLPAERRKEAFSTDDVVRVNANALIQRKVLAQEALRDGLDKDPVIQAALQLARDRVLSDARLASIDKANQPNEQAIEEFARTFYKAEAKRFEQPEQVRARHILVRSTEPDARKKAEQLLQKLKAGANFEEVAAAESQDPGNAARGGDLGFFPRGRMVPTFDEAAFKLEKPGQLSEVIESPFGFHIIRLEEKRAAGAPPFDEVKSQLMREAELRIINLGRIRERDRIAADTKFDEEAFKAFLEQARK
jgi:peptidyl-prolyl cis-trans isomerase C